MFDLKTFALNVTVDCVCVCVINKMEERKITKTKHTKNMYKKYIWHRYALIISFLVTGGCNIS